MPKVSPIALKFVAAFLLLTVWGVFAFIGKTSVEGFITAINSALLGLGVYHVLKPADATAPPVAPMPSAPLAELIPPVPTLPTV